MPKADVFFSMRSLRNLLILPALILAILSCGERQRSVVYLSPLNREKSGLIDENTLQLVGKGFALDPDVILRPDSIRINVRGMADPAGATNLRSIISLQTEGLPESAIKALPNQDLIAAQRAMFRNACVSAQAGSLYQAALTLFGGLPDSPLIDKNYFPPGGYYSDLSEKRLEQLQNFFVKNKYKIEWIDKRISRDPEISCTAFLYLSHNELLKLHPGLLTAFQD